MRNKALIYLHGFNSASVDAAGDLLIGKEKLRVLQEFCAQKEIVLDAPNVDYRDFREIVEEMLVRWNQHLDRGFDVVFMGSSMGGFSSEYLAMKTGAPAIMINPAIAPSELLTQFIGVAQNFETGLPYHWAREHCEQYRQYEAELANGERTLARTVLLDRGDELLDAEKTLAKYRDIAQVEAYDGGSHAFEHMGQALPIVERVVFSYR